VTVAANSAAQRVEAVVTGKPVEVFSWPARRQAKAWLWREDAHGAAAGLVERLIDWGLLKPPRDFAALHRALQARGLIGMDGASAVAPRRALDDMEQAVAGIRRLFATADAGIRVDAPLVEPNVRARSP